MYLEFVVYLGGRGLVGLLEGSLLDNAKADIQLALIDDHSNVCCSITTCLTKHPEVFKDKVSKDNLWDGIDSRARDHSVKYDQWLFVGMRTL